MQLIEPSTGLLLIEILSWLLIALGLLKLAIFAVGEWKPGVYDRFRSDFARKALTGTGNRLIFGLLGALTVLFGGACVALVYLLRYLGG